MWIALLSENLDTMMFCPRVEEAPFPISQPGTDKLLRQKRNMSVMSNRRVLKNASIKQVEPGNYTLLFFAPMSDDHIQPSHVAEAQSSTSTSSNAILNLGHALRVDPSPKLLLVSNLFIDGRGNIIDAKVLVLRYQSDPSQPAKNTYHIYAQVIVPSDGGWDHSQAIKFTAIEEVLERHRLQYHVRIKPSGDFVREAILPSGCPGGCTRGCIKDHPLLPNSFRPIEQSLPPSSWTHGLLCPVCVGLTLMMAHATIVTQLLDEEGILVSDISSFHANLSSRRLELGYDSPDLDAAAAGQLFDAGGEATHGTRGTLLYFPGFRWYAGDGRCTEVTNCSICWKDLIEGVTRMVALPCGRSFMEGCIARWLCTSETCPVCRSEVEVQTEPLRGSEGVLLWVNQLD